MPYYAIPVMRMTFFPVFLRRFKMRLLYITILAFFALFSLAVATILSCAHSTIPSLDEIGGGINVNTFTFTVPGPTGKTFKLLSITPWLPTIKSYVPVASQINFQVL